MPVLKLTMEQEFRLRQIEDALKSPEVDKDDLITVFIALQHQNFVLGNTVKNLIDKWGKPPEKDRYTTDEVGLLFGTLFGTKD
jgi:hypothetical protein